MWKTVAKLSVSLIALVLAFRDLNLSAMLLAADSINWLLVGQAVGITALSVVLLGVRWRQVLLPVGRATLSSSIAGQYIGLFGNNVFPLRLGELMRAHFMKNKLNVSYMKVLATIFVERLFDLIVIGGILAGLLMAGSVTLDRLRGGIYVVVAVIALVASPLIIWLLRPVMITLLKRRLRLSNESTRWFDAIVRGRAMAVTAVMSIVVWLAYAAGYKAVLLAVGLPSTIEVIAVLIVAGGVGFLIPAGPGAIGTYHLAVVVSLHDVYGTSLPAAQLTAILLHLTSYVPSTVIGFVFFLWARKGPANITVSGLHMDENPAQPEGAVPDGCEAPMRRTWDAH